MNDAAGDDKTQAYAEAALELGSAVALGAVPFLAQAIDAYDTLESCWRLYAAKKADEKEEAQFDMVLALTGWIPGPGDGIKKSLRIVNKDPQRYAPILFDLLRHVCELAGIKTSPEALLDAAFDAGRLKTQMGVVREAIEDFSGFKALPDWGQQAVRAVLRTTEAELPAMVGIVQRRLVKWKRRQPNSSALAGTTGRAKTPAVNPKDANVAKEGQHRPVGGSTGQSVNGMLATAALEIGNAALGVGGEHIADYYCGENLGWAAQWQGHDRGKAGAWQGGQPGRETHGKVSKGGNDPKVPGVLHKLGDGSNGTGIDAVWRTGSHNQGKPYAVVEAKSDFELNVPGFIKRNSPRKPGITAKLGVSGVPKLEEMLATEPPEHASQATVNKGPAKKGRKGSGSSAAAPALSQQSAVGKEPLVQMSREWIAQNIRRAVTHEIVLDFKIKGHKAYSRHLIYTPMWLPAMTQHAAAVAGNTAHQEATHRDHDVLPNLHYEEDEVKAAVNRKKANLRSKLPNATTLKAET